jgi:ABC-type Fe3+ transport system permease subunit
MSFLAVFSATMMVSGLVCMLCAALFYLRSHLQSAERNAQSEQARSKPSGKRWRPAFAHPDTLGGWHA